MTTISAGTVSGGGAGFLDKERTIATAGFNRWLVPPAALCIHLCIGMAYGFSVFWLPLSRAIGLTAPKACPDMSLFQELFTTTCDWKVASMGWMYTLFFVVLGLSAAMWGGWLERVGPRKAGFVAALCWCGGLFLGAIGIYHASALVDVARLRRHRRRRPRSRLHLAGVDAGEMVPRPPRHGDRHGHHGLWRRRHDRRAAGEYPDELFQDPDLGRCLGNLRRDGRHLLRVHDDRRLPLSHSAGGLASGRLDTADQGQCDDLAVQRPSRRRAQDAAVLADLVGALPQRVGRHRRDRHGLADAAGNLRRQADRTAGCRLQRAHAAQKATIAGIAAGFAGLLSLFNIGGRFFWASLSDKIGRKNTYYTFFILGIVLYALAPTFAAMGSKLLFVLGFGIILSMYGGGFATVPAYLADMFGTQFVGAIHGRLLTAWSTAGIIGPVVVNYIREFQLAAGVPRDQLYNTTMYILCAMLIAGLICNYLIKPVDRKWHMSEAEVAKLQAASASASASGPSGSFGIGFGGLDARAALFWAFVGIPLAWGVWITLQSAAKIL